MMLASVVQYFCDNFFVNHCFTTLVLFTVLIVLVIGWVSNRYEHFRRLGVDTPSPTFLVGNMGKVFTLKQQFGSLVTQWYQTYTDLPYIGYYNGLTPSILVRDPDVVKDVLIKDFASFSENDIHAGKEDLLSFNPFGLVGDQWKRSRSIIAQLFTANKIKVVFPLMQIVCDRLTSFIGKSGPTCDIDAKDVSCFSYV